SPLICALPVCRYRAARDLPSCPTRRSSDLELSSSVGITRMSSSLADFTGTSASLAAKGAAFSWGDKARGLETGENSASKLVPRRSEEHTSELQSRENLVCRLLLEKKHIQTS